MLRREISSQNTMAVGSARISLLGTVKDMAVIATNLKLALPV